MTTKIHIHVGTSSKEAYSKSPQFNPYLFRFPELYNNQPIMPAEIVEWGKTHLSNCLSHYDEILIITTSDALVLLVRLWVIQEKISSLTLSFDDEMKIATVNDRGVPSFWPEEIFSEAQNIYSEMRGILQERNIP